MAKKKIEAQEPAISTIPLPSQDSPLVIDLPDGQKLVVGNIAQGTVIEVATWRGTGRPDSRTNRLMLGVSSAEQAEQSQSSTSSTAVSDEGKSRNKFLVLILNFFKSLFVKKQKDPALDELDAFIAEKEREVLATFKEKVSADDNESQNPENQIKRSSRRDPVIDESEDIKSWLDDLMNSTTKEFTRQSEEIAKPAKGRVRRVTEKSKSGSSTGKKSVRKGQRVGTRGSKRSSSTSKAKKKSPSKRGNTKKRKR
ncbi:MAG: hypothetical protein EBY01_07880 [Actinobacteria bacterium]|nr:hypothetical protein [Actinomycetota bacterium]NDI09954.1 hypothetical protein [Actinomycetota bacterium]